MRKEGRRKRGREKGKGRGKKEGSEEREGKGGKEESKFLLGSFSGVQPGQKLVMRK
jgi:hypothetical protein